MNFAKLGFAALLLVSACDKPDDKMMQSTSSMASASAKGATMAPSMASTGAMATAHDMGMGTMAPAMGSMTAPAGSAPMMNDKSPPKMGASANQK